MARYIDLMIRRRWLVVGLVALLNGGYVTGRLVAAAADGLPERAILLAWGFEFLLVVAALWLLAREPGPGRARA